MNIYPLPTLVAVARELSPYYRELYAGLPQNWQMENLPLVDQKAYWQANTVRNNRLLTGPLRDGIVFKSGGTTGDPKFSVFSRAEWRSFTQAFGSALDAGGLRDGERVANIFYAGELYASFVFIMNSLEHARADALQFPISGRADFDVIEHTVRDFDIDVVMGVPTTLVNLAEHLLGEERTLPSVKRLLFGGESLYPDQRQTLATAFPNAHAASIGYASVDAGLHGYADLGCGPDEHRVFGRHTIL
ncbi:MAG: AMP-binding protein [Sulfuricellaceae bacterium]